MSTSAVEEALEAVRLAFSEMPRPEHFTDYRHCCERAEHDETLRSYTPETIGMAELGNGGWDPICFVSTEGYLYYMQALARLACGTGPDYYLDQFLFHLNRDRIAAMNEAQRKSVQSLLATLLDARADEISQTNDIYHLEQALYRLDPTPGDR